MERIAAKVNLQDVPIEHLVLEEPKAYQEHAVFYHRPHDLSDINGQNPRHPAPERQTEFRVEQVVVLADEEYRQFQETGFLQDQIFLFDYQDKMWFDPGSLCWHCVLVKGRNQQGRNPCRIRGILLYPIRSFCFGLRQAPPAGYPCPLRISG